MVYLFYVVDLNRKISKIMKNKVIYLILFVLLLLVSCDPESDLLLQKLTVEDETSGTEFPSLESEDIFNDDIEYCGEFMSRFLINNGNFEGGEVFVANDEANVYIKVVPKNNWLIGQLNIFVGDIGDLPVSGNNRPIISKFTYSDLYESPLQEVIIPISYQDLLIEDDRETVHIAVMVKLINGDLLKSVFAEPDCDDCFFTGSRGGGYFTYIVQPCEAVVTSLAGEDVIPVTDERELLTEFYCTDPAFLPLLSKNNDGTKREELGSVTIFSDGESLVFQFTANEGLHISSIHINVGEFEESQFNSGGNIPAGKFDFKLPFTDPTNDYPVEFPISLLEPDFSQDFKDGKAIEKFIVQATLVTMEMVDEVPAIVSSTSVYAQQIDPADVSSRQERGSVSQPGPGGTGQGGAPNDGKLSEYFFELLLVPCE